eukprot:Hpha_TRINITY_DN2346_c0_g1::TRINITY_DN2346_c0_g1_i1::g.489::m.489
MKVLVALLMQATTASSTASPTVQPLCTVKSVWAGDSHNCILQFDHNMRCFGGNENGQLGYGDTTNRGVASNQMGPILPYVDIRADGVVGVALGSVGERHGCFTTYSGAKLKCFGMGDSGRLGSGSTTDIGDGPGEMGGEPFGLPTIPVPGACTVHQVQAGRRHNCLLCSDHVSIYCWGQNQDGLLGVGDTTNRGDIGGWSSTWTATDLGGGTVTKLFSGSTALHMCAVFENGKLKCWGWNNNGQLGLGDQQHRGDTAESMTNLPYVNTGTSLVVDGCAGISHTCVLFSGGSVECWGYAVYGSIGTDSEMDKHSPTGVAVNLTAGLSGQTAKSVVCGYFLTCALSDAGRVTCWGHNTYGQLGRGDTTPMGSSAGDMAQLYPLTIGSSGAIVTHLAAGTYHVCALLHATGVFCWGRGDSGQLGHGGAQNIGDNAGEMGSMSSVDLSCPDSPTTSAPSPQSVPLNPPPPPPPDSPTTSAPSPQSVPLNPPPPPPPDSPTTS